jgi:hypothetical protein
VTVAPDDYQIAQLTRDLGKLEGIVASMAKMIELEHDLVKESRREAREQLEASSNRIEQILKTQTQQIGALTEANRDNSTDHAKRDGAISLGRWLFASGLSVAVLLAGWFGGKRGVIDATPSCPAVREAEPTEKVSAPLIRW